jgi:predicted DNA-binding antitoxin AbrB/MazE fold protein
MIQHLEAVYEHGILRPLAPLSLAESQRVHITISDRTTHRSAADLNFLDQVRAEAAALDAVPTMDEVQAAMSKIPGSLTADFIEEREDVPVFIK